MKTSRAAFLLVVLGLPACGKKGDPLPPLRPTPAAITGLRLAQRGDRIEIAFVAPRASTDGARLPVLDLELFVASGEGDFLKLARSRRFKAAPGEAFTETEPLPVPGTTLRAAARALARGHRGSLGEPARLVVVAALAPPTDLSARPSAEGVTLSWRGEVPAPLPTPTPLPTPIATPAAEATPPADAALLAPAPRTDPSRDPSRDAPPTGATPLPKPPATPKPTPTPFAPGFFIYRRTAATRFGPPLRPRAEPANTFVDPAKPGESWCYVVRAVASGEPLVESVASKEACLEVKDVVAPARPAGLTALAQADGVEARWSASPEADLATYRIYRTYGGKRARIAEVKAPDTRYLDADAPTIGLLRYFVTAVDAAGNESGLSLFAEVRRP